MKFLRRLQGKDCKNNPITFDERFVIKKCIRDGDIVLDVGAHHGEWSEEVLKFRKAEIHAFEAANEAIDVLKIRISDRCVLNWNAVSSTSEDLTFHVYRDYARFSSLHGRRSAEEKLLGSGFDEITVPGITLDTYWANRPERIRFLRIDVEGAEYDVLRGASMLLRQGRVDFLQFEYGGTFLDADTTLRNVWAYLRRYGYRVFRVGGSKLTELKTFRATDEDYAYSNYIAVNERLTQLLTDEARNITLDFDRLDHFAIKPSGALHVGAHNGNEIKSYRKRNITPVVFVEANPDLPFGSRNRFASDPDVTVIEAAASDREGTATFNITSMDQSSSLLDLKDHAKLYPKIRVDQQITVRTGELDHLLAEHGIDPSAINFIAMDIQGAELMALHGAQKTLEHIEALQIEINYSQLYEGCALIGEIDAFLGKFKFIRIKTYTPYSEEWGDALYVKRPTITCSVVGSKGRFANHIFQYIFAQTYAADYDFDFVNPIWAGDDIFDVQPGKATLPDMPNTMVEDVRELANANITNDPDIRPATDFIGFFQYHTRYYCPHKSMIKKHLTFKGPFSDRAARIEGLFQKQPGPVVTIHLRRGDFGSGYFFIAPEQWYIDWLNDLRKVHPNLSVYIASDDLEAVAPQFADFRVLTENDLPKSDLAHDFFTDFAALTLGDHVAISNSSFSFAASMLNDRARMFMRPDLTKRELTPYAPWNAHVLLREAEAEEEGEEFMSERAKGRSKYKIQKIVRKWPRGK